MNVRKFKFTVGLNSEYSIAAAYNGLSALQKTHIALATVETNTHYYYYCCPVA